MAEWIKLTPDSEDIAGPALYYCRVDDTAPHKFAFRTHHDPNGVWPWDKGITDAEAIAFARQLPEVQALVQANAESGLIADEAIVSTLEQLKERNGLSHGLCILADELRARTAARRAALAPFKEATDGT